MLLLQEALHTGVAGMPARMHHQVGATLAFLLMHLHKVVTAGDIHKTELYALIVRMRTDQSGIRQPLFRVHVTTTSNQSRWSLWR